MSLSAPLTILRAPRAPQRLIAILLACTIATPAAAAVDCYERMSRIPTAAPAAPLAAGGRASMLRGGPVAVASPAKKAAQRPARKTARKAKAQRTAVAHKAKGSARKAIVRKVSAKRNPAKVRRRIVAAAPAIGSLPTPPAVAARDIAALREFTLIKTTICTTIAPPAVIVGPPVEPETVLPPLGPEETFNPDITVLPPDENFVVVVRPPRPPGPPAIVPLPRPVPEPGTWLLLILGFGAMGARLRARRTAID